MANNKEEKLTDLESLVLELIMEDVQEALESGKELNITFLPNRRK